MKEVSLALFNAIVLTILFFVIDSDKDIMHIIVAFLTIFLVSLITNYIYTIIKTKRDHFH